MKKIMIVLLLLSSTVYATEPVRVVGHGNDIVSARHDAFKKAVEFKVGSMVISEKDVRSSVTVRNDVLVYSAGYVDDYEVIVDFDGKQITLDIYVSKSRLANRIISRSNSMNFQGSRHDLQLSTLQEEKELSRRYVNTVMKEFPYHAVTVGTNGYNLTENNNGQYLIEVPYVLTWNPGFLNATKEMLTTLSDKKGNLNKQGNANIVYVPKKQTMVIESLMLGSRSHYIFDNPELMFLMKDHVHGNKNLPVVRLNFKDSEGNVVRNYCQRIRSKLFNTTDNHKFLIFYEKEKEIDSIKVLIDFPLENISDISLEMVRYKDCFL